MGLFFVFHFVSITNLESSPAEYFRETLQREDVSDIIEVWERQEGPCTISWLQLLGAGVIVRLVEGEGFRPVDSSKQLKILG